MSETITFTGCILKGFGRNHHGGKASFSANYTASVGKRMGWAGFPDGATSVSLEGSLAASSAKLQPADGALQKWVTDFEAQSVKNFEAVRYEMEGKKGKGFRYELHFVVEFVEMTACRQLEAFLTHVGQEKASLTVSYTKAAEQTEIDLAGDERRQATLADND